MTKFRILLCLFCFAPLFLFSQDSVNLSESNPFEDGTFLEIIKAKWKLNSIQDPNSEEVYRHEDSDILHLSDDGFTFVIASRNINTSGSWECNLPPIGTLILKQNLVTDTSHLDSSVYMVVKGKSVVAYFKEGVEVVRIEGGEVVSAQSIISFKLGGFGENSLTLEKDGAIYFFIPDESGDAAPPEAKQSGPYKSEGFSFESFWRGMLGIITLLAIAVAFSSNRRAISWSLVGKGLLIQLIFALLVLKVPAVAFFFEIVSSFFIQIISFTKEGTDFLFKSFVTNKIEMALINFVIQVLPTIVFFAALTSLLYYWGILQKIVYVFAWIMKKVLKLSGAESLAAAGNIFLGQTESPLLIRPYLDTMTRSELMCLMSGGMATIAGGVLAAYIGFLGGDDPEMQMFYAKHLLAASVMSAPAAVVAAKILVPETEDIDEELIISKETTGTNALEAIANGTTDGIRLAVNVAGMLLVFIAFIAMANFFLEDVIGKYTGLNDKIAALGIGDYKTLSLQFILGLMFAPLSWLMGVDQADIVLVGQLLGEKTILNEFVAYVSLGDMKDSGQFVSEKSIIMSTYILCGFANFASIGIQIGGIGALAPKRKGVLASLGMKALIGGTLASLFTAVLVGMIL